MENSEVVEISKFLSLILRHKPETIGIELDHNGWADCAILLKKLQENGYAIDVAGLEYVVENNNKSRFSFSEDRTKIRANQGHSIPVDVELQEAIPPYKLFHGTAEDNIESIKEKGILKQERNYVHLSKNYETAVIVGVRYGKPKVLKIRARDMYNDGITFFLSKNGVWLTDYVDAKYIGNI